MKIYGEIFKKASKTNKYNNHRSKNTDSNLEARLHNIFLTLQKAGEIEGVERLDKNKDFTKVLTGPTLIKNGKTSKLRDVKYTPDFKLENVDTYLPIGQRKYYINADIVYIEAKTKATKTTDYQIRKKLFLSEIKHSEVFIEIEYTDGKYKVDIYRKIV